MLPGKGGIVSIVIVQKRVLRCDCCLSEIDDAVVTKVYNGVRSDMCSDCQARGYVLSDDLRFSRRLPGDVVQSEQSASAEVDA